MTSLRPPQQDIGVARPPRWAGRALAVVFALLLITFALLDRLGLQFASMSQTVVGSALLLFALTALLAPSRRPVDFYVDGRDQPAARGGINGATGVVGLLTLGFASGMFASSVEMLTVAAALLLGLALLALLFASRLRRLGVYTAGDFLAARFGTNARLAGAYVAFSASFLILVASLTVAGAVASSFLGMSPQSGLLTVTLIAALAVLPGGMRSLAGVQGIQYAVAAAACFIPAIFLGWRGDTAPTGVAGLDGPLAVLPTGFGPVLALALPILLAAVGAAALPQMLAPAASAASARDARAGFGWAIAFSLVLMAGGGLLGHAAVRLAGAPADPFIGGLAALSGPVLAGLPPVLAGLVAAGVLALLLGAAQAALFSATAALSHDLWDEVIDRGGVLGRRMFVARVAVVCVAAAAAWLLAGNPANAAALLGWALALAASGNFMPLLLGLYWRRCNGTGALAGTVAGLCVASLMFLIDLGLFAGGESGLDAGISSVAAATLGVLTSFVVAIAGSLLTPPPPSEESALLAGLRGRAAKPPLLQRPA